MKLRANLGNLVFRHCEVILSINRFFDFIWGTNSKVHTDGSGQCENPASARWRRP